MTDVGPGAASTRRPGESVTTVRLTVAVLTFRRAAYLREALPLVAQQVAALSERDSPAFEAEILVVDNDPAGSARDTVDEVASATAVSVRYVVEPLPGIVGARNRALDETSASDLLAFIDDDEVPDVGWLDALLATWLPTRPAAVAGYVASRFDGELSPWVAAGSFFQRRVLPTGTPVEVGATSNLLLDLEQVRRMGVRFDARIGLGSGEDSLFTREIVRHGGSILWCQEATAIDRVPRERMTRQWVLDRARSHGNAETVVQLCLADGPVARAGVRLRALGKGVLRMTAGGARFAAGVVVGSLRHQARGLRTAQRGAGMASGAFGVAMQEYARPH